MAKLAIVLLKKKYLDEQMDPEHGSWTLAMDSGHGLWTWTLDMHSGHGLWTWTPKSVPK